MQFSDPSAGYLPIHHSERSGVTLKRRSFLKRTGWLATACGALSLAAFKPGHAASLPADGWAAQLLDALPNRAQAVAIGKARLADLETPPDAQALSARLARCIERLSADGERCTADSLRSDLKTRIAADFAENRTVRVRGWVLASSEADLFCLAALAET